MANYIAHYRKKLYTLARKKLDLNRLLERDGTEQEVVMAAEAVRESQIRVLAAKRAQVPAFEANADRLRAIDEDIASCLRLSVADIIASCRQERAKSSGK
jgi:hypothetical protein